MKSWQQIVRPRAFSTRTQPQAFPRSRPSARGVDYSGRARPRFDLRRKRAWTSPRISRRAFRTRRCLLQRSASRGQTLRTWRSKPPPGTRETHGLSRRPSRAGGRQQPRAQLAAQRLQTRFRRGEQGVRQGERGQDPLGGQNQLHEDLSERDTENSS